MKKTLRIFSLMLILAMVLSVFTACDLGNLEDMLSGIIPSGEVTVTWKYGQKVLKTQKVPYGSTVSDWTPTYGDRAFNGWYADAGLVELFDFSAPIKKNTEIYASFGSGSFGGGSSGPVTVYLIPGADWSSDGSAYGIWCWGNPEFEDTFILAADTDNDGVHEVEIPEGYTNMLFIDLVPECFDLAGDWDNNRRAQTNDLVVPSDNKVYFFVEVGNWSTSATEIPEPPSYGSSDFRFIGSFNDWDTGSYGEDDYKLTLGEDGKTWTGTFTVTADMYRDYNTTEIGYPCATIKLYDVANDTWVAAANSTFKDNNAAVTEGTWCFEYVEGSEGFTYWEEGTEKPDTPVIPNPPATAESDIRFIGSFNEWSTTSYGADEFRLTLSEDGKVWTGTFTVTVDMYAEYNVTEIGFECATVKLYDLAKGDWIGAIGVTYKDNNAALTEGTYHFEYIVGAEGFTYWEEGTEKPESPVVPETPETPDAPTTDTVLYLVPNENWLVDGARFAVYMWNDAGDAWVDMTDSDGDGVYEATVPAGYVNIIFCRMNPSNTDNQWGENGSHKWNQTANLLVPSDNTNCYTVAEGAWDKGEGTWSTK